MRPEPGGDSGQAGWQDQAELYPWTLGATELFAPGAWPNASSARLSGIDASGPRSLLIQRRRRRRSAGRSTLSQGRCPVPALPTPPGSGNQTGPSPHGPCPRQRPGTCCRHVHSRLPPLASCRTSTSAAAHSHLSRPDPARPARPAGNRPR
jgi:hypothetical protein